MFFSRKKKSASSSKLHSSPDAGTVHGITSLPQNLRMKFKRGVNYNMKILLRGDRNVGKSCLLRRLQGGPFIGQYIPTEEIQVASVEWSYKTRDDVIKVDIWDVVDRSRKKTRNVDNLKITNDSVEIVEPSLDASFIDVYQGAHGVVLMFDVTKPWTWDYVKTELPRIPSHIPVLVLANKLDVQSGREVAEDSCRLFLYDFARSSRSAVVRYGEASMRNGFGLKLLHLFFNVPFLLLELDVTIQEIDLYEQSPDGNYSTFLETRVHGSRKSTIHADELCEQEPCPVRSVPPITTDTCNADDSLHEATNVPVSTSVAAAAAAAAVTTVQEEVNDDLQNSELNNWLNCDSSEKIVLSQEQFYESDDSDSPNPMVAQIPELENEKKNKPKKKVLRYFPKLSDSNGLVKQRCDVFLPETVRCTEYHYTIFYGQSVQMMQHDVVRFGQNVRVTRNWRVFVENYLQQMWWQYRRLTVFAEYCYFGDFLCIRRVPVKTFFTAVGGIIRNRFGLISVQRVENFVIRPINYQNVVFRTKRIVRLWQIVVTYPIAIDVKFEFVTPFRQIDYGKEIFMTANHRKLFLPSIPAATDTYAFRIA
ncbi:Rab-like protein 6 [Trichinella britovi]|uniref:Rab-like protein 6 n=1 Tax=Trichinella britovi TaxID=45882 RepID=A0A0V1CDQ4_TRIBR|nr:Rab-like protein 6 [Trichinella britovi]